LAAGHDITGDPRPAVTKYVALHQIDEETFPSLAALMREIANQVMEYGTLGKIPAAVVRNTRNDMYLASEAIRFLMKDKEADLSKEDVATLNAYKGSLDNATKFIPFWVKLAVAIALGLGTMIGWKRIVVTVGEKIGKTHLSYGQGAGRARGCRHDLRGRPLRPAGVDHPRAVVGRRRHHGGERIRPADVYTAQHRTRLGAHAPVRDDALRVPLLGVQPFVLRMSIAGCGAAL
jgi:hypothetical protein